MHYMQYMRHMGLKNSVCSTALLWLTVCLVLVRCSDNSQDSDAISTVIINAQLIDGTGSDPVFANLRIKGDEIVAIGDLFPQPGELTIDADGLTLAPGFIDTHSHHDRGLDRNRSALPLLTQGITTAVFGQDGSHNYPIAEFFTIYEQDPAAINVASYIGHNTLRDLAMGERHFDVATQADIDAMLVLFDEEFASGAIGLSSGLEYEPGLYSESGEVFQLAQRAAQFNGRYSSHIRSEDRFVFEALQELIDVGINTGIPIHYSHMKLAGQAFWGEAGTVIDMLDAARQSGVQMTADIYPYEYWQSTIEVLLPNRDPDDMQEIEFVLNEIAPADGIIFTDFKPNPDYVGLSIADIARLRETSDAQTLSDVIKASMSWRAANPGQSAESIMGRSMQETDIAELMGWEFANICSDGSFTGHPRGYGAFPRVLAHHVRDTGQLTLSTAIAKMTSLAANSLGIEDRGKLAIGMKADLVLFNPGTIQDHATVDNAQKYATGISRVWVNGEQVLIDGEATGARPGRVIKRSNSN